MLDKILAMAESAEREGGLAHEAVGSHMRVGLPAAMLRSSETAGLEACTPNVSESSRRTKMQGLFVGALLLGLAIAWFAGLRNDFVPANFGVVEPGKIFRSAQISQQMIRHTLEAHHIGLIVNLANEDTPDLKAEELAARELGVGEVHLGLSGDGLGDPDVYPKAIAEIISANQHGKAVLVHCQSGAQRTGGIIATYRILVEGQSPEQAFAEMRQYGHDPKHNPALIPFIKQHLPHWKMQLEQYRQAALTQPATLALQ
jgi:protein tyrosine phosphatase (PTP) superfamily phosphohydrolase (DUF442 family)